MRHRLVNLGNVLLGVLIGALMTGLLWSTSPASAVSIVLSALVTIGVVVVVERFRKPDLRLEVAEPVTDANGWRVAVVHLRNARLPWILQWMSRDPAMECHGTVTFCTLDRSPLPPGPMPIRWSKDEQPIGLQHFIDKEGRKQHSPLFRHSPRRRGLRLLSRVIDSTIEHTRAVDLNPFLSPSVVHVYPDEEAQLAVVVRHNDTNDSCYGWSNQNYRFGGLSPWVLKKGEYRAHIKITSSSRKIDDWFRLVDDGTQAGLRLEPDKRPRGATAHRLRKWFGSVPGNRGAGA